MFQCELVDLNVRIIFDRNDLTRASIGMEVLKEAIAAVLKGKMSILITKLMFIYHRYNSISSAAKTAL